MSAELVVDGVGDGLDEPRLQVAVVGPVPWWVGRAASDDPNASVSVAPLEDAVAAGRVPDVLHVALDSADGFRSQGPLQDAAVIVDATCARRDWLGRRAARACARAQGLLVRSRPELREVRRRYPAIAKKTFLLVPPVDLDAYGPEEALAATRGRELKRFRRYHRLVGPTVLFAGPYTHEAGFDLAIDAALRLRAEFEDVRLAAIPLGETDGSFLDRCERRALALGHHGIVEQRIEPVDVPLWFAVADVVVFPSRTDVTPPGLGRALAAARPIVAAETEPLLDAVTDGETGVLVAMDDPAALAAAVASVLAHPGRASALGAAARAHAERELAPELAVGRLRTIWAESVEAHALANGRPRRAPPSTAGA